MKRDPDVIVKRYFKRTFWEWLTRVPEENIQFSYDTYEYLNETTLDKAVREATECIEETSAGIQCPGLREVLSKYIPS